MSNRPGAAIPRPLRTRLLAAAGAVICLGAAAPPTLPAQVGYPPERSPFQDVTTRQSVTFFASRFFGNRAVAGVGAQGALAAGGRFTATLSGPIDLIATVAVINSRRTVIDPSLPDSTRRSGPVDYRLVSADLGLALNLTGQKTWHGLMPYVAAAIGIVAPTSTTTDPGGYRATSHLTFVPTVGTAARLGGALWLTLEARDNFIRYDWPSCYFGPTFCTTAAAPPVLDPNRYSDKQMTHNLTLAAGLSFRFNF